MTNLIATYAPTTTRSDNLQDAGFKFQFTGTTGSVIKQLGIWKTTGNTGNWTVSLRNAGNTQVIASATINMSTATAGQFNYASAVIPATAKGAFVASGTYFLVVNIPTGQTYPDTTAITMNNASGAVGAFAVPDTVGGGTGSIFGTSNQYGGVDLVFDVPASAGPGNLVSAYDPSSTRSDNLQDTGFKFIFTGATGSLVTQLGAWKTSGNTGNWVVSLRNSGNTTVLASVTIAMAGAAVGQFNYASVGSPPALTNGSTYFLVSNIAVGQVYPDNTNMAINSGSTVVGTFSVPDTVGGGTGSTFGTNNQYGGVDLVFVSPIANLGLRPQQQWEMRRLALDENDTYIRPTGRANFASSFVTSPSFMSSRPQQQWEMRRVALDENDTYRRPIFGSISSPGISSATLVSSRPQQQWEMRRVALDEDETFRRPVRGFAMAGTTFEIAPWLGAETFLDASGNPSTYVSYMGMENWINDQTVTFGKVDYLGTEVFLAHVGLSGAYTSQLMLETWLLAATDEKGVESTKLGAENWLVPASWSAQIPKLASEVFLVVPFTTATVIIPKFGSEVFMEKSGQSSAFIPKMGVEVFFPNVSSLTGNNDVNIVIWMH